MRSIFIIIMILFLLTACGAAAQPLAPTATVTIPPTSTLVPTASPSMTPIPPTEPPTTIQTATEALPTDTPPNNENLTRKTVVQMNLKTGEKELTIIPKYSAEELALIIDTLTQQAEEVGIDVGKLTLSNADAREKLLGLKSQHDEITIPINNLEFPLYKRDGDKYVGFWISSYIMKRDGSKRQTLPYACFSIRESEEGENAGLVTMYDKDHNPKYFFVDIHDLDLIIYPNLPSYEHYNFDLTPFTID